MKYFEGLLIRAVLPLVLVTAWLAAPQHAGAQFSQAGIFVDADGVLRKQEFNDPTGQLTRERIAAARATLDPAVAASSPLRKVSLNRLEAELARRAEVSRGVPDEMRYLAGLTRLKYVFFYPESNDIVIAGPAEGWVSDLSGRVVGLSSGQPVLELQDLVVALRAHPPGGQEGPVIGCSIDPTPEGLARMREFLQRIGRTATPADTEFIVDGLRNSLGLQTVRITGIRPDTHFAQVMVEADYRMKLIGIGLEIPPVRMASYVDRANPSQVARNALQRWYFTPDYECVRVSEDRLAMELVGDGVKLVGEDELVTADGQRRRSGSIDKASQAFVTGFTSKYPLLARKSPVYAQLRNLIDMAVAAAYIQREDFYGRAGWTMETLADEETFPVQTYSVPQTVETVVTSVWKGNRLMTPVGGGVNVQTYLALEPDNMLADEDGQLEELHGRIELPEGQWWWD